MIELDATLVNQIEEEEALLWSKPLFLLWQLTRALIDYIYFLYQYEGIQRKPNKMVLLEQIEEGEDEEDDQKSTP